MITKPKIEIDLTKVEKLASLGLNQVQIASALGISEKTLRNRKKESAEFAEALKNGRAKAIAHVSSRLMQLIDNGNVTAMIFWLKTQAGWREADKKKLI